MNIKCLAQCLILSNSSININSYYYFYSSLLWLLPQTESRERYLKHCPKEFQVRAVSTIQNQVFNPHSLKQEGESSYEIKEHRNWRKSAREIVSPGVGPQGEEAGSNDCARMQITFMFFYPGPMTSIMVLLEELKWTTTQQTLFSSRLLLMNSGFQDVPAFALWNSDLLLTRGER